MWWSWKSFSPSHSADRTPGPLVSLVCMWMGLADQMVFSRGVGWSSHIVVHVDLCISFTSILGIPCCLAAQLFHIHRMGLIMFTWSCIYLHWYSWNECLKSWSDVACNKSHLSYLPSLWISALVFACGVHEACMTSGWSSLCHQKLGHSVISILRPMDYLLNVTSWFVVKTQM